MNRRNVIGTVCTWGSVLAAGCLDTGGDRSTTKSDATTMKRENIGVELYNGLDKGIDAEIRISQQDSVFDQTMTHIEKHKQALTSLSIPGPGVYEIEVSANSRQKNTQISLEDYHFKNNRSIDIQLNKNEIIIYIQD